MSTLTTARLFLREWRASDPGPPGAPGVVGLTTKDLVRRAVEMEVPGIGVLRVIHPIDVLDSRIQNLHVLPGKRTPAGIAQAMPAVDVARAPIRREIAEVAERAGLRLLERVRKSVAPCNGSQRDVRSRAHARRDPSLETARRRLHPGAHCPNMRAAVTSSGERGVRTHDEAAQSVD